MIAGTEQLFEEAHESLERMQQFDVSKLPREADLGTRLNFGEAVEPAQQLIDLYKRLSITALEDFPDNALTSIRDHANNNYKLFSQIIDFDPSQQNPSNVRDSLIDQLRKAYQPAFQALHMYISYSLHRAADFQRLDADARATIQAIEDKASKISKSLSEHEKNAKSALEEIRRVAAEEGVTKQAVHFSNEYDHHNNESEKWKKYSVRLAIGLGAFAIASLFVHKIPFLKPDGVYDAIQLSLSKVLIFSVMAYMLFLSAKNFLNHKHNAIVNKHRQNALMTHSALVESSGDDGVRDAVLLQASSCIFSPQPTGYTSGSDNELSNQKSMVEILSRPVVHAVKDVNK